MSLHVLLHAVAGHALVWYSAPYGDHDDYVELVAVHQQEAETLFASILGRRASCEIRINEGRAYYLDAEVRAGG